MPILSSVNLSPSCLDVRALSSSSSYLISIKSFFLALSKQSTSIPFSPTNFIWKSKGHQRSTFAWLAANKKVNTNDVLQVRRSFKALSPDCYTLCMGSGESIDHLFIHYSMIMEL